MTLLASLLTMLSFFAPGAVALDLPAPLEEKLRELRLADASDVSAKMAEVLSAEIEAVDAFIERLRDPKTRVAGLSQIAANDEGEAARIGGALPEGMADAILVRTLLGPYLLAHVTFEVDSALSNRMRGIGGRYEREMRTALAVVPKDSASKRKRKAELVKAWRATIEPAERAVEDKSIYPDKDRGASGQKRVDQEVRNLWKSHRYLVREFDDDLQRFQRADRSELQAALEAAAAWRTAHAACSDILASRKGVRVRELSEDADGRIPFARAMLLVASGDPQAARHLATGSDEYLSSLLRYLWFLSIVHFNDDIGADPSMAQVDPIEREVVRRLNEYRMALDRTPLEIEVHLIEAARGHSKEMGREDYFSHDSPHAERATYRRRIQLAGYANPNVAECIFMGVVGVSAEEVFLGWYNSSIHHRILISKTYAQIGVGRAGSHITANFGGGWTAMRWEGALEHRRNETPKD